MQASDEKVGDAPSPRMSSLSKSLTRSLTRSGTANTSNLDLSLQDSTKSLTRSLTRSGTASVVDLADALVPAEPPKKNAKKEKFGYKNSEEQLGMLRVINSEARKKLHKTTVSTEDKISTESKTTPQSKAATKLRATLQAVTKSVETILLAGKATAAMQQDVKEGYREQIELEKQRQIEEEWMQMFSDVDSKIEAEERAAHHKIWSRACGSLELLHPKVKGRPTPGNDNQGSSEGYAEASQSPSSDKPGSKRRLMKGKSTTFQPTKLYNNVHSVIGLGCFHRSHREQAGISHPEYDDEREHDNNSSKNDRSDYELPDSSKRAHANDEQHDEDLPISHLKTHPSGFFSFKVAQDVIRLRKNMHHNDHVHKDSSGTLMDSVHNPPLPTNSPRNSYTSRSAIASNRSSISEEKVFEESSAGSIQSQEAHNNVAKANFLKERAARMAARAESEDFMHFPNMMTLDGFVLPSERRLGIGEFLSPSRLTSEVWELGDDDTSFFAPNTMNTSTGADLEHKHEFPGKLVCTAIAELTGEDIARMFIDIGAPQGVMQPQTGLELLERLFGGVHTASQYPIQWMICEWALKDRRFKMFSCIRKQKGVLSTESRNIMNHTSGESFRKQLSEVQVALSQHYTIAPKNLSDYLARSRRWRDADAGGVVASSQGGTIMQQGSLRSMKQRSASKDVASTNGGMDDSHATLPSALSSAPKLRTPRKPIRQQKLPYFPYSKDRLKVLNLDTLGPTNWPNWPSSQAPFMNTQIRGCGSAR